MSRYKLIQLTILSVMLLGGNLSPTTVDAAVTIAATGFNDASGINSNTAIGSPYLADSTILGMGASEPGWTGTWTGWTGDNNFIAQSNVVYEGDLALKMQNSSSGLYYSTMREYIDQTGIFYLDFRINVAGRLNNSISIYTGPNSWNAGNVASHVILRDNGTVVAFDGDGAGGDGFDYKEETGFNWTANEWMRITQEINISEQSYRLWVNEQEYLAPDPLNFYHTSTFADDIRFLLPAAGYGNPANIIYVDAIQILNTNPIAIPAPSALLLGSMGICFVSWLRRRRTI